MNDFQENRCRLCRKFFCCKNCRYFHEETKHNVDPLCDICVYGKIFLKDVPIGVLTHVQEKHWPLHCVFCEIIFNSLQELVEHAKCSMAQLKHKNDDQEKTKSPATPLTPITPINPAIEQRSLMNIMSTPFYKGVPGDRKIYNLAVTTGRITSTPMQKQDQVEKITPVEHISEIKYTYKSSLKLTGSSGALLNDSKKSDRRVTFSETPVLVELGSRKIIKHNVQPYKISEIKDDNGDEYAEETEELYVSFVDEETYETATCSSKLVETDNLNTDNRLVPYHHDFNTSSLWESALTHIGISPSDKIFKLQTYSETDPSNSSIEETAGLWNSMTNIVKSALHNISLTAQNSLSISLKRPLQYDDMEEKPQYKRRKFADIKCRRPIRPLSPLKQIRQLRPKYVDKATQTDEKDFL